MDVNGTRFHLLLGRDDWGSRCTNAEGTTRLADIFDASKNGGDADFSWDERRSELTLGSRVFHFTPASGNRSVDVSDRRGAAADAYGNVYWIDESGTEIQVHSAGTRVTSHFWSSLDGCATKPTSTFTPLDAPAMQQIALSGLAVTSLHYLVVGTLDPAGLLVFDLHRGGEPRQLLWPVAFAPFDLVATKDGGVWVLDTPSDAAWSRAWRLDRTMGVVPIGGDASPAPVETFHPLDESESRCKLPSSIALAMARSLTMNRAVAIEVLPDDSILVLDSPPLEKFSRVVRITRDGTVTEDSTEKAKSLVEEAKRPEFQLRGHDFVLFTRDERQTLYVAGSEGDQAVAFRLDTENNQLQLHALAEFFPMRLFGARGLIAGAESPLYDAQDRWVPLIEQRRQRFAHESLLLIPNLDGKQPDCVWHRLMFDACIPPECDIVVESRATNDPAQFELVPWSTEPRLLRRVTGSELAWSNDTREAGIDTWELLFQRATGRYLQIRLTLHGTGRSSPRIRALRAWYPRFSYLDHYLPDCYRENADSASFLDRFLANTEGFFTNIEDRIAAAQCLLDTACAPAETLEWLASWFEVALDPAWDEEKRRLFLRHAADFFEWRGTMPGLMMALRLVSEDCADPSVFDIEQQRRAGPRIVERFRTRRLPGVLFGDTSAVTETGLPLRLIRDKWEPAAGAADLHRRWAEFTERPGARYPIVAPSSPDERAQWIEFSRSTLGFVPSATEADTGTWQEVLRRRYSTLESLKTAWQTAHTSWGEVRLFRELPARVEALRDWVHFEGLVLTAAAAAHRFTVFLPQETLGIRKREQLLDLARRVIALEKPAHTTFDVKFYWAFFRIGEARLGDDTVVDLGSRSPELLSPFILDRNYLGSGWLGSGQGRSSSNCGCPPSTKGGSR
ncbi:MAG TPA: phage tail protein [Thermoanaerobaculia bacterium]|nr:phage tail protein [Thermoanaerobaculia bacterium]